jgi:hypothetical protein
MGCYRRLLGGTRAALSGLPATRVAQLATSSSAITTLMLRAGVAMTIMLSVSQLPRLAVKDRIAAMRADMHPGFNLGSQECSDLSVR